MLIISPLMKGLSCLIVFQTFQNCTIDDNLQKRQKLEMVSMVSNIKETQWTIK